MSLDDALCDICLISIFENDDSSLFMKISELWYIIASIMVVLD